METIQHNYDNLKSSFLVKKQQNLRALGRISPFPIKNPTLWVKIIQFTTQKSLFLEQNNKIFVPAAEVPHFQLEIRPFR